jgi:hypothetical protein
MISDNQTDQFIKDRLRDYPSSVPADMWSRIVEKKKRDRKILLFFFRLLAFIILLSGLTVAYFIFYQKKLTSIVQIDNSKVNQGPSVTDTAKASPSNLPSAQDQIVLYKMKADNKKIDQKEKVQGTYSGALEHVKVNIPDKADLSKTENTSKALSPPTDSNEINKNKTENKKDSLIKKFIVKTPAFDSSGGADLKKTESEKKLYNRKWFLDVYASPDYPIISPPENEQSKLSYTLGIRINRSLGKHFSVKTAIQFSQINLGGDSLSAGMTIHLMRLDLPVLAGYSVGDEKFRTTFNGGVILNLYSWLRGNVIPDFFKTNTGLSLYLGVNLENRINKRFSLFGEPYYRYQLTSMTVNSISSMKFIDIVGVNIGARYYFGK